MRNPDIILMKWTKERRLRIGDTEKEKSILNGYNAHNEVINLIIGFQHS